MRARRRTAVKLETIYLLIEITFEKDTSFTSLAFYLLFFFFSVQMVVPIDIMAYLLQFEV